MDRTLKSRRNDLTQARLQGLIRQDRPMTGICQNPAGIRPIPYRKTIPSYLSQLRPVIRALPPWAAPQRRRIWPAGMMLRHPSPPLRPRPPSLGQPPQRLWPGMAQAGAHVGKQFLIERRQAVKLLADEQQRPGNDTGVVAPGNSCGTARRTGGSPIPSSQNLDHHASPPMRHCHAAGRSVTLQQWWLIALVSGRGTGPRAGSKGRSRTGRTRAAPAATDRTVR